MNIKRHALQLLLSLLPLAFASVLMADETEIYFAGKSGDVPPNVLFLIDASGSMGQVVSTDTAVPKRTRMQILKDSFNTVMTTAPSNLNVGLMHYANHGLGNDYWWSSIKGVNFPVTAIDDKVQPLIATYQADDNLPNPATGNTTVREFLASVVNGWNANGYTPIVDSLYEASRYFRGDAVNWGRGHPSLGWTAHPMTYDSAISCDSSHTEECINSWDQCNSDIVPGSCSSIDYNVCCNWVETNSNDGSGYCENNDYSCPISIETCEHTICDTWSGAPSYKTPVEYKCQANYLVLMSDGKPEYPYYPGLGNADGTGYYPPSVQDPAASEVNAAAHTSQIKVTQKIPAYIGATCADQPFGYASGTCGSELTHWLASTDLNSTLAGKQLVDTYAVAFAMDDQPQAARDYLASLVTKEGGFFNASNAEELAGAFNAILNEVDKSAMSFSSPAYTVDQNTLLSHSNDVYIPMFASDNKPVWSGNVKKFQRDENGQIVSDTGSPVLDEKGQFLDTARDVWSTQAGADVSVGGAASQLPAPSARTLYTDVGTSADLTNSGNALTTSNTNITDAKLLGLSEQTNTPDFWLPDADGDGSSCLGYYDDCNGEHHIVLGNYSTKVGCVVIADVTGVCPSGDYMTDEERASLLRFARGEDANGSPRSHMGDMLNNKPLVLTYGTEQRVYVATNEGFLHSLDAETGVEQWAFMPKSLLDNIRIFYANEPSEQHVYGIDGQITPWLVDWNGNGEFEKYNGQVDNNKDGLKNEDDDDKAYLYFGLRRGGKVYYALDVTNPDKPLILWKKENLADANDGAWDELGETWSKPALARMRIGNTEASKVRDVVVFGAGYDAAKDVEDTAVRPADATGRDVMIVDALSGELLWSLKRDVFSNNPDLNEIKHSVPSDIRVMDMDRNGALDRLYFADTGGNLWRVDMPAVWDKDSNVKANLTKIAALGTGGGHTGDPRKFFYEPDVALIQHNGQSLLSIALGSGYRTHPLNTAIDDRFYVIMDPNVYNAPPDDFVALTDADLTDRTSTTLTESDSLLHGNHKGWYYDFSLQGEKVLAPAVTFLNKVVFTTFAPVDESGTGPSGDPCDTPPNSARAYVLDLFTGKPVADLDGNAANGESGKDEYVVAGINEILNSAQIVFRPPEYVTGDDGELVCQNGCQQTVEIRVGKMSTPLMDASNSNNDGDKISESTDLTDIVPRIFWRDNGVSKYSSPNP